MEWNLRANNLPFFYDDKTLCNKDNKHKHYKYKNIDNINMGKFSVSPPYFMHTNMKDWDNDVSPFLYQDKV